VTLPHIWDRATRIRQKASSAACSTPSAVLCDRAKSAVRTENLIRI
jgi:hypothetical protein